MALPQSFCKTLGIHLSSLVGGMRMVVVEVDCGLLFAFLGILAGELLVEEVG